MHSLKPAFAGSAIYRGKLHLSAQAAIQARSPQTLLASRPGALYLPTIRSSFVAVAASAAMEYSKPFWLGAGAVTAAMIVFGTVNFGAKQKPAEPQQRIALASASYKPVILGTESVKRESVVQRMPETQRQSFKDRWEQARVHFSEMEQDDQAEPSRPVQTVRAKNAVANSIANPLGRLGEQSGDPGIGALAFAPASSSVTFSLASVSSEPVGRMVTGSLGDTSKSSESRAGTKSAETRESKGLDEVEQYLWEVYQRAPVKKDGSGDFTWKDPAAAKRFGLSMPVYVITGMDPDFREQLYHAGKAMDAAGVKWAILSAFRDDYRQSLASGFKASARNSLHGGSARVGGYGHGRAVDVTGADETDASAVWKWLDAHGGKYGLHRPMPGNDPAHVQSRGDWRKLAQALKASRVQIAEARAAKSKPKVVATAAAR
jgi:hypothetical protein